MLRLYRSFSTTVRRLNLAPPAELDAQELHVFKKLNAALEPTRLQVHYHSTLPEVLGFGGP